MSIVSAEKITMSYVDKKLLNNASLFIEEKDKIGVIGINGTGKSTLLKIIAGIEKQDSGTIVSGVRIGYLPQNPNFDYNNTVMEQVFATSDTSERELMLHEAKTILTKLGITEFDKKVSLLSGGQKKRVAIASALITPCELLILDEPTNHLDNDMVAWLEKTLQMYNGAILMVTHDRYFLDRVTNKIIEIDNGSIYTYQANYSKFVELKELREQSEIGTERKRVTTLKRELEWIRQGAQGRGTKSKSRIENYKNLSEQEGLKEKSKLELNSVASRLGRKTVEINQISKSFDDKCLIDNFEYIILRDGRIGIVGANGTGKSTLLNMISGKLKPDKGDVIVGETVKMAYFSQECEEMNMNMRVIDYIKETSEIIETVDGKISASNMLERFLFSDTLQWSFIGSLSGGERRRLYLLKIIMSAPNILLLDEPTNDLDIQTLVILEEYLENFSGAVVVVSHDRYFLDRVVDRVLELSENGVIKEYLGGYSDYLQNIERQKKELTTLISNEKEDKIGKPINKETKKLKFTFKEKYEFENIDNEISELEKQINDIELEIEKQLSNYDTLQKLLEQKNIVEESLAEKMDRWVYLNDLSEKINNT